MNETHLIQRAQQGNQQAFLTLLSHYDKQVMSVVYRFSSNLFDREDLYQEVFLHCYKSINSFRFECAFATWLYRLALNRCITYMQRNRPVPEVQESPTDQPHDLESREKLKTVHRAMTRLTKAQRICFHLFYVEDWDLSDIAELLKCRQGTVKSHLNRARKKVRADEEVAQWKMDAI